MFRALESASSASKRARVAAGAEEAVGEEVRDVRRAVREDSRVVRAPWRAVFMVVSLLVVRAAVVYLCSLQLQRAS